MISGILFSFGVNLLVASGLLLWYRVSGTILFHLAVVAVLPAYLVRFLSDHGIVASSSACWSAATLSLGLTAAVSVLLGLSLFQNAAAMDLGSSSRRRRRRIANRTGVMLGSLALYFIGSAGLRQVFGASPRVMPCELGLPGDDLASSVGVISVAATGVAVMGYGVLVALLRLTTAGLVLRAVTTNADLAAAFGLRAPVVSALALIAGSALVGLAGFLVGLDSGVTPTAGFQWLLSAAAAMAIAGTDLERGMWPGVFLGSALVAVGSTLGVWFAGPSWANAVVFGVLVAVLLVRPQGLLRVADPV